MTHGLNSTYNHGCRCDLCRAAMSEYSRARHLRRYVSTGYAWRPDRKPRTAKGPEMACDWCGAQFTSVRKDQRFCSKRCGNRVYLARKRAIRRANYVEDVTLTRLRERDGDKCGLCGKQIGWSKAYPDPLSPSIDHIIPQSEGGTHEYRNTWATHLRCNLKKHIRPQGEQLRLIG